jgi:hypothetical protein
MPIHHLIRLALIACLWCTSMAGAQAQVSATPQTIVLAYNVWGPVPFSATDTTPGGPHATTYTVASPPAHGRLDAIFQGSVNYHPNANYVGEDSFTYTATTANGTSAPATVRITVLPPVPVVAYDGHFNVRFNTRADLILVGKNPNAGSDPRVYYELVSPPLHGSVVFGDYNIVSYTPPAGYAGPDYFKFRVRHPEWGTSNTAVASINVAAAALPVAHTGRQFVPHGAATAITLTGADNNPGGPYALAYALHTPPAHGSVVVNGDTATYTPGSAGNGGYWGEDSFSFTASSANGTSAPAAVRVLVGQPVTLGTGRTVLGDTGQTACTDSAGTSIACAALTGHPGQDGRFGRDAQAGAPAFDYLADGGCVVDRVTGLTWSADTLPARTWAQAASASDSRCGIATGWRLPTRRELLTLVHHGASNPASAFPGTQSAPYWSSDAQGSTAWAVDFADGGTRRIAQIEAHAARLVAQPVNQAPSITLGADIVLSNNEKPGPRSYSGWATGITPGPAREAGQQLIATVRLLPVPGVKTLEFDVPPAIDPATGDLTFTVLNRVYPAGQLPVYDNPLDPLDPGTLRDVFYWTSSAGRVQVEVTLQDDGGTAGGGVDATVKSFEIAISPVPSAFDIDIKHPWKAACIPVTLNAQDIDTDPKAVVVFPLRYDPLFRIKEYPRYGYLTDYVSRSAPASGMTGMSAKSISVPLGETVDSVPDQVGTTGNRAPVPGPISPWGFFAATICYVPFSSTFVGSDTFSYTAVDVDGNESAPASATIEIFEVR